MVRWSSDDEGANRLVGVIDTRGERALVAVAERGGGRVRILHYAPALEPFYATELTHVHRCVRCRILKRHVTASPRMVNTVLCLNKVSLLGAKERIQRKVGWGAAAEGAYLAIIERSSLFGNLTDDR